MAEQKGEFPSPGPTPCVTRRGSIPFFCPPHLKNFLTALAIRYLIGFLNCQDHCSYWLPSKPTDSKLTLYRM